MMNVGGMEHTPNPQYQIGQGDMDAEQSLVEGMCSLTDLPA
jgi:hypothetical protein